jgi:hypothetical protein
MGTLAAVLFWTQVAGGVAPLVIPLFQQAEMRIAQRQAMAQLRAMTAPAKPRVVYRVVYRCPPQRRRG